MEHRQDHDSIGRRIACIHRQVLTYIDRELAEFGIGRATFHFFRLICAHDGIRQEELARLLSVDKATATRAVSKLESLGYAARERDPADGRAYLVRPTPLAQEIYPLMTQTLQRLTEILSSHLSHEERSAVRKLLTRMDNNISAYLQSTRDSASK